MKCYCCSVKKKFFESFAELDSEEGMIYLCATCNDLLYKIRDDANDKNVKHYKKHIKELQSREKNPQEIFVKWKNTFLENLSIDE